METKLSEGVLATAQKPRVTTRSSHKKVSTIPKTEENATTSSQLHNIPQTHTDVYTSKSKEESKSLLSVMTENLKAPGWLNLLADAMHNFTDGIAIGASFAAGQGLATAMFLSIIFHELPHEIGDFTILIQNGLSKWQAIKAQFLTAVAAVLGTAVGLQATRNKGLEELLLAFTSGGFVYLATVSMLPEIVNSYSTKTQLAAEMVCFMAGVGMMVAVALYE